MYSHYPTLSVLFVIAVLILLALEIGPAAIVGFGLLLMILPIQAYLGKQIGTCKSHMLRATDERTGHVSEAMRNIQIVKVRGSVWLHFVRLPIPCRHPAKLIGAPAFSLLKLYGWEDPFAAHASQIRSVEVSWLRGIGHRQGVMRTGARGFRQHSSSLSGSDPVFNLSLTFFSCSYLLAVLFVAPTIVGFATLGVYVLLGNTLTLSTALSTLTYIAVVRFPLLLIPQAYSLLAEARTSLRRMEDFFALEECPRELAPDAIAELVVHSDKILWHPPAKPQPGRTPTEMAAVRQRNKCKIQYRSISSTVSHHSTPTLISTQLRNVNVSLPRGALTVLVGRVGSGKSALLQALLRELWSLPSPAAVPGAPKVRVQIVSCCLFDF